MSLDLDSFVDALRKRGLRVTAARVALYRAVAELAGHPGETGGFVVEESRGDFAGICPDCQASEGMA